MKQVFKTRQSKFKMSDVPDPVVGDNELLIKTTRTVVSIGTETIGAKAPSSKLAALDGKVQNVKKGIKFINDNGVDTFLRKVQVLNGVKEAPGYSLAGHVIAKGKDVKQFKIGQRVAAAGSAVATHSEYVTVPRHLVAATPDNVTDEQASFTTMGSITLQGIRLLDPKLGENVLVIGLGLIGMIGMKLLEANGCRVVGCDLDPRKVAAAKEQGFTDTFVVSDDSFFRTIKAEICAHGFDNVLVCASTSSSAPLNGAFEAAKKKGRVVLVGAVGMEIERANLFVKEIDFSISCSYGPGRYDESYEKKGIDYPYAYVRWTENRNMEAFLWLLSTGSVDMESLITHRIPFVEAETAYDTIMSSSDLTVGVVFEYPQGEVPADLSHRIDNIQHAKSTALSAMAKFKPKGEKVLFGVIGAGGFASRTYLPFIYSHSGCELAAACVKTALSSQKVMEEFNPAFMTTDYHEVLNDESIDAIIIATRHDSHYEIAKKALLKGKHVLVEKPMALIQEHLDDLYEVAKSSGKIFSVGFNRRYSPLMTQLKEGIGSTPCVVSYRINAGQLPDTHWTQDKAVGGGRIIGEMCHFIDIARFLVDSEIENMSTSHITPNDTTILSTDNIVTVIEFKNGSLATIQYVSIGAKSQAKEKIEVFSAGISYVLDDFVSLTTYRDEEEVLALKAQNKGQKEQFEQFFLAINGKENSLVSAEDCYISSTLTVEVDKLYD